MWTSDMDKTTGSHEPEKPEDERLEAHSAPGSSGTQDEGSAGDAQELIDERQQMLDAMEEHYEFPGEYKVVVIARVGEGFKARLLAFLDEFVGEDGYRINMRKSSKGNFVSYHVLIHVISAEIALERKHSISRLEGVHMLL